MCIWKKTKQNRWINLKRNTIFCLKKKKRKKKPKTQHSTYEITRVETSAHAFCSPMQIKVDLEFARVRSWRAAVSASPTRTWPGTRSSRRGRCWLPVARDRRTPSRCRCPGPGRRRRSGLRWFRRPGSVKVGSGGNVYSLEELLKREGLKFVITIFFVRTGNVETQTDSRGTQNTAAPGVKLSKQRSEPAAGRLRLIYCMLVSWKVDVCRLPRRAPRLWARSRPLLCWGGPSPSLRGAPTACAATKQRENNRNRTN